MMVAFSAGDAAYWALAIFLVLLGVGSLVALVKLGRLFDRVSSFVRGTERDLLPVVVKTGGTVDRVNYQLDKLDTVTDSAVSMADSADTAVRAVSTVIATPVEKVSGLAAGIAHGFSSFKKSRNVSDAMDAGRTLRGDASAIWPRTCGAQGRRPPRRNARRRLRPPRPSRSRIPGRSLRRRRAPTRPRSRPTSFRRTVRARGARAWLRGRSVP